MLLSYWLMTVSSAALTGSLVRQWRYCAFVVLVDDCFFSSIDWFFVQTLEHYCAFAILVGDCFLSSVDLFFVQTVEELQKTEILKKGQELGKELGKTAGKAAETISKSGEQISQTAAYKTVSEVRVGFFFHGTAARQICVTH